MQRKLSAFIFASIFLGSSSLSYAARPLGSHQAEPIVASPVSSGSPAGVPFVRTSRGPTISPGVALTAPTAFGAEWGDVFFGLGGNYDSGSIDGSGYIGFGAGNASELVGLEANMNFISASDDFFEALSFNFKLHRMLGEKTAIAIGTEHTARHGDTVFPDESYQYVSVSHVVSLNTDTPDQLMSVPITIGVGNGRFNQIDEPARNGYEDTVSGFASIGFIPHPQISFLAEWVGHQFNAGASFVPFERWPVVVTAGLLDLAEQNDDSVDFGLAVGYTLQFGK